MTPAVLSSRLDLPFYLRLPHMVFPTWDPEDGAAAILPRQRLGQAGFSRSTRLVEESRVLDSPSPPPYLPPGHDVVMTCVSDELGEVPTLSFDTTQNGGYAELRPYTEATVFVTLPRVPSAEQVAAQKERVGKVLNHFLTMYRLVTQDPWVVPLNLSLDVYLQDDSIGRVPDQLASRPPAEILRNLGSIGFATEIGTGRQYTYRLNTLEDLYPGKILERPYLEPFVGSLQMDYEMPLHYDLLLQAQTQLKRRNYHVAVLEAETAFEVYVADLLVRVKIALGDAREAIMLAMEDMQVLGPLTRRISELDRVLPLIAQVRGWGTPLAFIGTHHHAGWKRDLYDVRNRVIHGGYRAIDFEQAKLGILKAKAAISYFEGNCGDFANRIQIYAGGDHLNNTAGRLSY